VVGASGPGSGSLIRGSSCRSQERYPAAERTICIPPASLGVQANVYSLPSFPAIFVSEAEQRRLQHVDRASDSPARRG
jgi:hypothetical protein